MSIGESGGGEGLMVIRRIQAAQGWTGETLLLLVLRYIEDRRLIDDLGTYLLLHDVEENGGTAACGAEGDQC